MRHELGISSIIDGLFLSRFIGVVDSCFYSLFILWRLTKMFPFILYCIFGLITSYATAIVTHINKQAVKLDEVLVQAFFWPYTIIGTLVFLIKDGKK